MRAYFHAVFITVLAAGCGDATMTVPDTGDTDSGGGDSSVADSAAGDSAVADSSLDAPDSGPADTGPVDTGPADIGVDAAAVTHYGIVSVANADTGGFVGQIRGAFVPSAELGLIEGGRAPIAGAPDCFEVLAGPPVVPTYLDAGTLVFDGLVLAGHMLTPTATGDYTFSYAGLFELPDDPVTVTVPGAATIEAMAATALTPDPASDGNWTLGSTGIWTNWTAGNGDYVRLRFDTSAGQRICEVPDTGTFLIPAAALAPGDMPSTGSVTFQRVIETITRSATGTQELRFRTITQNTLLEPT